MNRWHGCNSFSMRSGFNDDDAVQLNNNHTHTRGQGIWNHHQIIFSVWFPAPTRMAIVHATQKSLLDTNSISVRTADVSFLIYECYSAFLFISDHDASNIISILIAPFHLDSSSKSQFIQLTRGTPQWFILVGPIASNRTENPPKNPQRVLASTIDLTDWVVAITHMWTNR